MMGAKSEVRLRLLGIRAVMQQREVQRRVDEVGRGMAVRAGEGYEYVAKPDRAGRARGFVQTADRAGRVREAREKRLSGLL